jgi:hypothetical protein
MVARSQGLVISELSLNEDVEEISVPYNGQEYVCPNCEQSIPTRRQQYLARPAKYAHILNDVQKCPFCSFVFSYRIRAYVLRG